MGAKATEVEPCAGISPWRGVLFHISGPSGMSKAVARYLIETRLDDRSLARASAISGNCRVRSLPGRL